MYHSINIGGKNTWDDWKLIPTSRPLIAPPEPKTNYVDIPGMDGELDYTEIFGPGSVKYKQRTGSWEFIVVNLEQDGFRPVDWATRYSAIMTFIQGYFLTIRFEDDPAYVYKGRVRVSGWTSGEHWSTITFEYNVAPYKYPVSEGTGLLDWRWNDLFDTTIFYGTFDVVGSKARNFINPTPNIVYPTVECSSTMTMQLRGVSYTLPIGRSTGPFPLTPGDNNAVIIGNGRILIDYKIGVSL